MQSLFVFGSDIEQNRQTTFRRNARQGSVERHLANRNSHPSGTLIAQNIGWGGSANLATRFAQVGAFALAPNSADDAILTNLSPGNYTIHVNDPTGKGGAGAAANAVTDAGAIASVWGTPWMDWKLARDGNAYVLTGGTKDISGWTSYRLKGPNATPTN